MDAAPGKKGKTATATCRARCYVPHVCTSNHAGWYVCTGVGCHVQITTERLCCQSVRGQAMGFRLSPDPDGNCLGQRACTSCNQLGKAVSSSKVPGLNNETGVGCVCVGVGAGVHYGALVLHSRWSSVGREDTVYKLYCCEGVSSALGIWAPPWKRGCGCSSCTDPDPCMLRKTVSAANVVPRPPGQ